MQKKKKTSILKQDKLFGQLSWPKKKKIERKKKDTCLILHDAVTLLTTLLVSEIKMAAQIPRLKVSDVMQGFLWWSINLDYIKIRKVFD